MSKLNEHLKKEYQEMEQKLREMDEELFIVLCEVLNYKGDEEMVETLIETAVKVFGERKDIFDRYQYFNHDVMPRIWKSEAREEKGE